MPPPADRHRIHQIVQSTEQWGEWAPHGVGEASPTGRLGTHVHVDQQGNVHRIASASPAGSAHMVRYGKKRAGNALDGKHIEQLPDHYTARLAP